MAKAKDLPVFLKVITIQGFKSFADRVKLELGYGLNVIVGPNGSGKSNVADAVRWVLGEQSVKSLRGTKMEDFIFTGTVNRRPVGMAEVSLVFDNTTGIFPLEFQELTITRRLYRNGEGQFFINKAACRLKDIQELFMDTGAGKEGFSIIGQGRVAEILNSRSEERRFILEEAAGISKFRARKKEALKRLDNSEQNLLRVKDILQEIETQLGPLEAQALIAERSLELETQRKLAEVQLVVGNLAEVRKKLAGAQADTNEFKTGLAKVMAELARKESEYLQEKSALNHCERKLQEQQNGVNLSEQSFKTLTHDLDIRQERQSYLQERIMKLGQEINEENQRLRGSTNRLKGLEDKLLILKRTIEAVRSSLAEDEQKLKLAAEANQTGLIEDLKAGLFELLSQKANYSNEIRSISQTLNNLNYQAEQIKRESRQIVQSLEINRNLLDSKKIELFSFQKREETRQREATDFRIKLGKVEEASQESTLKLNSFLRKAELLRARWQALRTLEDSHEGYQQGVREIMLARKKGISACTALCGTVAELLKVEKKLELAMEISLGGALQNVIAKTVDDASQAIAFLKNKRSGRATFLPLDIIQANVLKLNKEVAADPGFVGIALDLVKYQEDFRPAMEFLLGKIIIVKDMPAATRIAGLTRYKARIVTLEGDQVNPGGSLTGGSGRRQGGSLLGRSREIAGLCEELKQLEPEIKAQEKICADLKTEKQDIKDRLEELALEKKELSEKTALVKINIQDLEKQTKRREEAGNSALLREKEIASERAESEERARLISARLDSIEQEAGRVKTDLSKYEQEIRESTEQIKALSEKITGLKVQAAKLEQEFKQSEDFLVQEQNNFRGIENLLEHKLLEQDTFNLDDINLKQEIEDLSQALEEKSTVLEKSSLSLALLRQERESLLIRLKDCEQILQSQRQAIQSFEQKIHAAELRTVRLEAEWETGATRLNEEFSLSWENAGPYLTDLAHQFLRQKIQEIKQQLEELGPVNQASLEEYPKMLRRRDFLS
ncbi:MAG: chromosome segregation protein SMC, partial [Desulfitobacteriaceae bacterium]|nr:chromosome segregation protein SMC [Desulfitobacteriaceae bacterium]